MALSTYADLQTSIADFANRSDLGSKIPSFIQLVEARLNREIFSRFQHKRVTANTTSGDPFVSLPTDLREIKTIRINSNPRVVLANMTLNNLDITYSSASGGTPVAYAIVSDNIKLSHTPSSVIELEMIYSAQISALSDSNTNNVILLRHPDVYLYGALMHLSTYLLDETKARSYDELYTRAIQEINTSLDKEKFGSSLAMKDDYTIQLTKLQG
tara:strand:+ start:665 stop:1306 length:642 start_codon:yes stop_codon:yes gene_type:complete